MSGKRPPAPPPALAGFTYVEVLGSGGFADVYLYEQQLPRRRVAVKVLLADRMGAGAAEQFAAEANVMALLSTHPAIVTIYQAGVSDDGRPYLVMEYCSRPNLQVRSRAQAFSVAEALRVGVQVAAAVETAHRAGILHRDIKPANILVTEYNRPALTDFGIATTAGAEESSTGMSIPWSPPEAFSDQPASGVATDVYALGATVYTLLAGRSPFEQPGGRNSGADLIQRIETEPAAPLGRPDVPASLEAVLERAMSKRPGDRYESAVAFARALQRVQIELAHSVTPIDILDDSPEEGPDDDEDGELTRVRGIVSIEPHTAPAAGPTRRRPEAAPAAETTDDPTLRRSPVAIPPVASVAPPAAPAAPPVDDTIAAVRPVPPQFGAPVGIPPAAAGQGTAPADAPAPPPAPAPASRRGLWIGLAVAASVVITAGAVAAVAGMLGFFGGSTEDPVKSPASSVAPQDPVGDLVPAVSDPVGVVQGGEVVFTWVNPDPKEGDAYIWYPYTLDGNGQAQRILTTSVTLPADPSGRTCIKVTLQRSDSTTGPETRGCTP